MPVLRFYEGLDDAEIADVLGCAVGTVRSQASRGLAPPARPDGRTSVRIDHTSRPADRSWEEDPR
ncbi:MAG: hypothetical protein IPO89_13700 [Actinomycetales bacterium]|nr:hypothetical protein [Candidatus Lutibacillus vidarii]